MRLAVILIIYIAICAAALGILYGPLRRALSPERRSAFGGAAGPSRRKKWPVRLVMGIHPRGFCWTLEPDASFQTPEAVLVFSDQGLGGMTRTFMR